MSLLTKLLCKHQVIVIESQLYFLRNSINLSRNIFEVGAVSFEEGRQLESRSHNTKRGVEQLAGELDTRCDSKCCGSQEDTPDFGQAEDGEEAQEGKHPGGGAQKY